MGRIDNKVSGPVPGTVIQAGHIGAVNTPPAAPTAMAGLPPLDAEFTGRATDLVALTDALRTTPVTVVSGLAGIGKTTLAVKVATGFAGEVLFIDLEGYTNHVEPPAALLRLLTGLGVPPEHIPADHAAREVLYRSLLDERPEPVLVFLDNASSAAQVRSLLPGSARHRVLITSRHILAELNARLIGLDVLPVEESIELVSAALATRHPDDPRVPTEELVHLAGQLPLALSIIAAVLADDTTLSIAELTELLRPPAERLDELRTPSGDHGVRRAFDLSYARLSAAERRLFRLLSLASAGEVGIDHATALSGEDPKQARKLLSSLRRAHLLEHGRARGRFRSHDLLRLYAAEQADLECDPTELHAARERLAAHLTDISTEAVARLLPTVDPTNRFPDPRDAVDWLTLEWPLLIKLIESCFELEHHDHVAKLVPRVLTFAQLRGGTHDCSRLFEIGLASASRLDDRRLEALVHQFSGYMHVRHNDAATATRSFRSAMEIFDDLGDMIGLASSTADAAMVAKLNGDLDMASKLYRGVLLVYERTGYWQGATRVYYELGCIARRRKDLRAAEKFLTQAADICADNGFASGVAFAMTELGIVQNEQERNELALSTFHQAQQNAERAGDVLTQASIAFHIGKTHWLLGNPESAIPSLRQALRLCLAVNENAQAEYISEILAELEDQPR